MADRRAEEIRCCVVFFLRAHDYYCNFTFVIMFFISAIAVAFFINQAFKRKRVLRSSGIKDIDEMDGIRFEYFLKELYISLGYKVKVTTSTGDFGADLVLIKEGQKVVVQVI